jgi:hypothetical protein
MTDQKKRADILPVGPAIAAEALAAPIGAASAETAASISPNSDKEIFP